MLALGWRSLEIASSSFYFEAFFPGQQAATVAYRQIYRALYEFPIAIPVRTPPSYTA